ncbi:MAG: 30S ribosomal protein S5 [Candidatus Taylorbacteria bacterium]|nr:30S ribosomal protein S5 [Candidatus Taylorbacteria bacterium]
MPAKEIKQNKDNTGAADMVVDLKVPPTGVPVEEVVEAVETAEVVEAVVAVAPSGKVTPGKRMRDSARHGGRGGQASGPGGARTGSGSGQRGGGRGGRGGDNRERVKPEFDSKIIDIRRVTRVTAGGRRMNFSVAVVAGDRKGRVGVGLGKGGDTASAVEKATREAKKHIIRVPLSASMTIPHAVEAKLGSARIKIFPARGSGVVAGSSARAVIELAGIKDVCAKILSGSKNRLNNARVAIEALNKLIKIPRTNSVQNSGQKK